MALRGLKARYIPQKNVFYRDYYHYFIVIIMVLILLMLTAVGIILYQMLHRPLPTFNVVQPNGQQMFLVPHEEPNLLPDTILRWASKAAAISYTFDFVNYNKQVLNARPYFTDVGWRDYVGSVDKLIDDIISNQLIVTGVVAGVPVISNQGPLPDVSYAWRVQIPFLVSYQSANTVSISYFYVILTIVRVPTFQNPQGIGIDQFIMRSRN